MPLVITIFLVAYLGIGFIYALWLFFFGYDRWYWFPINWFFGLPVLIIMAYYVVLRKKSPLGRY